MALKEQLQQDVKTALRAGLKEQVQTLRMLLAAIQQHEVDSRADISDTDALRILEKLVKQRRESAEQYTKAERPELAEKELQEADMLRAYLPEPLDDAALDQLIIDALAETGASSPKDMGKVMNLLRAKVQGRADMSQVSKLVKTRLLG
ncbi:MAG: GatB/YqeY domain-containing protein [Gammaproteobacteria bacterium]